MASRFSINLFILACCVTYSSATVTSWQEEFEMKMEAKMNELIESKNDQLEEKVSEKVTQLEAQLELNVRTFSFSIFISSSINSFY